MRLLMIMILLLISVSIIAQETETSPAIDSENVLQLQSVQQLDFNNDIFVPSLNPNGQDELLNTDINIGWFVYSQDSDRFLLIDSMNTLYAVFADGAATYSVPDADVVDAVAFGDGFYAILFVTPTGFSVWYDNLSLYGGTGLRIDVTTNNYPSAIWVTCPDDAAPNGIGCYASVEATEDFETIVMTMPIFDWEFGGSFLIEINDTELEQRPYAPSIDEDAVVRIGRITLPYVVTSSLEGIVKLWNLDTSEIIYETDNGTGEPSVFGNINADATQLVWRDNANETLYLLNFITGENQEIAPLNGDYAQWYFLSNDASVIIAVNLGGEPNVVVWDIATGERTDLGHYRDCERPQPDMARLTPDGTTLIIGCDTGLDIWRINQEG